MTATFAFLVIVAAILTADMIVACLARSIVARLFPRLYPSIARYGIDTGFADYEYGD